MHQTKSQQRTKRTVGVAKVDPRSAKESFIQGGVPGVAQVWRQEKRGNFRPKKDVPKKEEKKKVQVEVKEEKEVVVKKEPEDSVAEVEKPEELEKQGEEKPEKKADEEKEGSPEKGKQDEKKADEEGSQTGDQRGLAFEGLPNAAFRCHLCKKSMWDARSFDNHIHGVAHLRMLDTIEKEYSAKAKSLREACHSEELRMQRSLEHDARMKNKPLPTRRDFCKMCDMTINGSVLSHRRSSQHQALKNHLHPKCSTCQIDLPSRIDLDIHVLTAEHLKRLFRDVISKNKERKRERSGERSRKKIEPVGEFDPKKPVGESFMLKVTGMFCKLCRRFFLREDLNLKDRPLQNQGTL
ncbi:zinc finger protein on ecdysone puffs-like [Neocloeon triangulifer]|uniref:zinc finger protein on ecdysone puffs-like n=1 Tax=Neocloeon triangulifer TaxID=2078957 RepID=UPI00286EB5D3|nr:zinc finger protein on ecdysone puffs-like [Neocloeon triangulifer]